METKTFVIASEKYYNYIWMVNWIGKVPKKRLLNKSVTNFSCLKRSFLFLMIAAFLSNVWKYFLLPVSKCLICDWKIKGFAYHSLFFLSRFVAQFLRHENKKIFVRKREPKSFDQIRQIGMKKSGTCFAKSWSNLCIAQWKVCSINLSKENFCRQN